MRMIYEMDMVCKGSPRWRRSGSVPSCDAAGRCVLNPDFASKSGSFEYRRSKSHSATVVFRLARLFPKVPQCGTAGEAFGATRGGEGGRKARIFNDQNLKWRRGQIVSALDAGWEHCRDKMIRTRPTGADRFHRILSAFYV